MIGMTDMTDTPYMSDMLVICYVNWWSQYSR